MWTGRRAVSLVTTDRGRQPTGNSQSLFEISGATPRHPRVGLAGPPHRHTPPCPGVVPWLLSADGASPAGPEPPVYTLADGRPGHARRNVAWSLATGRSLMLCGCLGRRRSQRARWPNWPPRQSGELTGENFKAGFEARGGSPSTAPDGAAKRPVWDASCASAFAGTCGSGGAGAGTDPSPAPLRMADARRRPTRGRKHRYQARPVRVCSATRGAHRVTRNRHRALHQANSTTACNRGAVSPDACAGRHLQRRLIGIALGPPIRSIGRNRIRPRLASELAIN